MPYALKPILPPIGRPPKHAARSVARFIRTNRLDRRTAVSRIYEQCADLIAADAGGWEHCNNREALLIRQAAGVWCECYVYQTHRLKRLAKGETVGDANDGYYISLLNSFRRTLESLGLRPDPIEKKLPTLRDLVYADAPVEG